MHFRNHTLRTTRIPGILLGILLQHHYSNSTAVLIYVVRLVHPTCNWVGIIVIKVVMQLPIASTELLLLKE